MVTKYDLTEDMAGNVDITPVPESHDGRFVAVEDYDALAAENAALKDAITTHSQSTHFCELCGKDDPCSTDDVCYALNETPATDAALAVIQAQGVEKYAADLDLIASEYNPAEPKHTVASSYADSARSFAKKLREAK